MKSFKIQSSVTGFSCLVQCSPVHPCRGRHQYFISSYCLVTAHCMDRLQVVYSLVVSTLGRYCYEHPYISFCAHVFLSLLSMYLGVEMLGHISLCLTFWGTATLFSKLPLAPAGHEGSSFPICSPTLVIIRLFNCSQPCGYTVVTHCGSDLQSSGG